MDYIVFTTNAPKFKTQISIQSTITQDKGKHQILTTEKLKQGDVGNFCLKNDSND